MEPRQCRGGGGGELWLEGANAPPPIIWNPGSAGGGGAGGGGGGETVEYGTQAVQYSNTVCCLLQTVFPD